jgi:hypothetical protein
LLSEEDVKKIKELIIEVLDQNFRKDLMNDGMKSNGNYNGRCGAV